MFKLYYGNGNCSIEGSGIVGIELRYKGSIEIEDKTSDSFAITYQNNALMVFPNVQNYSDGDDLTDLFDYTGEFKIISIMASNKNAEEVSVAIHRVMDYSELLGASESITTKSENLSQSNVSGRKVAKNLLKQQNLENLDTSKGNYELYYKNGTVFNGRFKIDLSNNEVITQDGTPLFYKGGRPTKNESLIPYGAIKQRQRRKQAIIRTQNTKIKQKKRRTVSTKQASVFKEQRKSGKENGGY